MTKQMKFFKNFESLLNRYQVGLETLMKGSDFIFDFVHLLYYKSHKITFKRDGSYIDSFDWIKNKKPTINPINKNDNACFQYVLTVTLNHEQIRKDPQIITKTKPFIDNCEGKITHQKKMIGKKLKKII